ncbi:hypothetical protein C8F01DRAFT_1105471 [Mycena amicta]|nr:hypothetical protein C8F01DRAFT_1105471 [Mycena amicta]
MPSSGTQPRSTQSVWEVDAMCELDTGEEHEINRIVGRNAIHRKTIRGSYDAVWPLGLDIKLVQGMIAYDEFRIHREEESKFQRVHGRNTFISRFILSQTNMQRTPKQIASRVQHLRGLSPDKRIRALIDRKPREGLGPLPASLEAFERPSSNNVFVNQQYTTLTIPVAVKADDSAPFPSSLRSIAIDHSSSQTTQLCTLDRGMVMLLSEWPLSTYSTCKVFRNDAFIGSFDGCLVPNGIEEKQLQGSIPERRRYWSSFVPDEIRGSIESSIVSAKWSVHQMLFPAGHDSAASSRPLAEIALTYTPSQTPPALPLAQVFPSVQANWKLSTPSSSMGVMKLQSMGVPEFKVMKFRSSKPKSKSSSATFVQQMNCMGMLKLHSLMSSAREPEERTVACGSSPRAFVDGLDLSPAPFEAGSRLEDRHPATELEEEESWCRVLSSQGSPYMLPTSLPVSDAPCQVPRRRLALAELLREEMPEPEPTAEAAVSWNSIPPFSLTSAIWDDVARS